MSEVPKLHGWITPEYAEQMVDELLTFLEKQGRLYKIQYDDGDRRKEYAEEKGISDEDTYIINTPSDMDTYKK